MHYTESEVLMFPETKEPNRLELTAQGLSKRQLDKYKVKRKSHHVYKAASKLWARGVAWEQALSVVQEAFDAVLQEE